MLVLFGRLSHLGICMTLATLGIGFSLASSPVHGNEARPNVILVMADDQGWGDMAYNGHATLKTPHFDKLAKTGFRMARFYAAAPVCSPTRASVLTGRHPNRLGVFKWGYPMRPQEQTLAEVLQEHGYTTGHFGKWHLGSVRKGSPASPGQNGFDEWISAPNFYENHPILSRQGKAESFQGESSMVTMRLATDWMKKQVTAKKPFLAVVWFGSPHSPHVASAEDRALYAGEAKNKQNFYGEVTGMDRALGELQSFLTKSGVRDKTILWYTSDNGALPRVGSTGGFRGQKGTIYEGGLLVPSLIQWPAKIKQPVRTSFRGNSCDILPTILDAVGIKTKLKHDLDGISLLPLLQGKLESRARPMGFWDYQIRGISTPSAKWMKALLEAQQSGGDLKPDATSLQAARLPNPKLSRDRFPGHAAWIDGDWKLHRIEDKQGKVKYELYHLKEDSKESTDRIKTETKQAELMKAALQKWLASVVDSYNGDDY